MGIIVNPRNIKVTIGNLNALLNDCNVKIWLII